MSTEELPPPPGSLPPPPKGRTHRRLIVITGSVVGGLVLIAIIGSLVSPSTNPIATSTTPGTTDVPTTTPFPTPEATTPVPPIDVSAPKPIVLKGTGSKVRTINLEADTPLVVTGSNSGSSNFIVELLPGPELVFNEIGPYSGQAAIAEITSGRYRVKVDAEGSWSLKVEQPVPASDAKMIPGRVKGKGAKVIALQVRSEIQPVVTATHHGESNFIVELIGYGDLSGEVILFNEIGNFNGQTITDDSLPTGGYLLYVQADGSWSLSFTP